MPNYRSLVPGGFFQNPDTSTRHVSIRSNNPGAINGASWEKNWPGYVKEVKFDGKNNTTIFETPEQGIAVWYELMRKYRASGAVTIKDIVRKYGGGQANYNSYGVQVAKWMGVPDSTRIVLEDDKSLLPFAKAMFRYEAGETPPWSDAQIVYGFNLARGTAQIAPEPAPASSSVGWLASLINSLFGKKAEAAPVKPPVPTLGNGTPTWHMTARLLMGKVSDGPSILPLAAKIAELYPDMKKYCALVGPDTSWCGLLVAYCLAMSGIRPPYNPKVDTDSFLWARCWTKYGIAVTVPRKGDILVFDFGGGDSHVTFYDRTEGDRYICVGGNQNNQEKESSYAIRQCIAIRRVPV